LNTNLIIYIALCAVLLVLSFIFNRQKTKMGLKKAWNMFKNNLLTIFNILILVSIALYFVSSSIINQYLGPDSGPFGLGIAAVLGSVTLIPNFVTFPIAKGLITQGASYAVVTTFMTTLMMVGIVTLPLEIRYFGRRAAITRNSLNFIVSIIIGLIVGAVL
jgi:uncharacterized membrane protein YraQ (UPF0718 family)